ncbi:hypothetical protein [Saccharopolyspora taberi]|uniref:Uncharacterized protein n=1 Tax=Saccharopolyspora taberi TaxID=60895 RepID=A0ABN3V0D8_9PSEU
MGWQQVSHWAIRCDGDTTHGQCQRLWTWWNDDDETWDEIPQLFTTREVPWIRATYLRSDGWLLIGNRALCPDHVNAGERLAEADISGLPFEVTP